MALFGRSRPRTAFTKAEQQIVDLYVDLFAHLGLSKDDAAIFAADSMSTAIREAKQDGSYDLPDNLGDIVLSGKPASAQYRQWVDGLRASLPMKRVDGMTDDDFREHWNQLEVARRMRITAANVPRMSMMMATMESGEYESVEQASEVAAQQVHIHFGRFGSTRGFDPEDPSRPLPFEVESSVIRFQETLMADWANTKSAVERAGSMNAAYRESLL